MPKPENVLKHKIKKGEVRNPNGRPKGLKRILKDEFFKSTNIKLTPSQIKEMMTVLLGKTKKELTEIGTNDEMPFWLSIVAKKAMKDYKQGRLELLEFLLDRTTGKPALDTTNETTDDKEKPIPIQDTGEDL